MGDLLNWLRESERTHREHGYFDDANLTRELADAIELGDDTLIRMRTRTFMRECGR